MSCGLRDVLWFESQDRPAVLLASAAFEAAATRQAAALGQPEVRRVLVAHPIADRTDEEMHELARQALADVVAAISLKDQTTVSTIAATVAASHEKEGRR